MMKNGKILKLLGGMAIIFPMTVSASTTFYFSCESETLAPGKSTKCEYYLDTTVNVTSFDTLVKASSTDITLSDFQKDSKWQYGDCDDGDYSLIYVDETSGTPGVTGKNLIGSFTATASNDAKDGTTVTLTVDKTQKSFAVNNGNFTAITDYTFEDTTLKIEGTSETTTEEDTAEEETTEEETTEEETTEEETSEEKTNPATGAFISLTFITLIGALATFIGFKTRNIFNKF